MDRNFNYDYVKEVYKKMGYRFFDTGSYNVNIFGIRSNNKVANKFDDLVCVAYMNDRGSKVVMRYDATTDPGTYWLKNPMTSQGCAILYPGQYRGSHQLGMHKGKYKALVQRGKLKIYRDNNKDNVLDFNESNTFVGDGYGINIHRATSVNGKKSIEVNDHSAGCQVIASKNDYDEFISICERAAKNYGNSFTYTLFTENQFFGK